MCARNEMLGRKEGVLCNVRPREKERKGFVSIESKGTGRTITDYSVHGEPAITNTGGLGCGPTSPIQVRTNNQITPFNLTSRRNFFGITYSK